MIYLKTVFCDIDGTFIGSNHLVSELNVQAVKKMNDTDHRFVLISGRGLNHVEELVEEHQLACDFIFANGAGYKLHNQAPQFKNIMSLEQCQRIIDVFEAHGVIYYLHTSHGTLIKPRSEFESQLEKLFYWYEQCGLAGATMVKFIGETYENAIVSDNIGASLQENSELKPLKFEVLSEDESKKESLSTCLQQEGFYVYSSYLNNREVTLPNTTKGNAIKQYLDIYPTTKTYGIGDGENDIDMLKAVDTPIAVANASEDVKALAEIIIDDANHGSVGKFILEYIL